MLVHTNYYSANLILTPLDVSQSQDHDPIIPEPALPHEQWLPQWITHL